MKLRTFALALFLAIAVTAHAQRHFVQKIVPVPASSLSREQEQRALESLETSQPDLATFLHTFPNTTHRFWQSKGSAPRTHISFTTKLRDAYVISLSCDGRFDSTYTSVQDVHLTSFTVAEMSKIRQLKQGDVLEPIRFAPDELAAFCADPDAAITRKAPGQIRVGQIERVERSSP